MPGWTAENFAAIGAVIGQEYPTGYHLIDFRDPQPGDWVLNSPSDVWAIALGASGDLDYYAGPHPIVRPMCTIGMPIYPSYQNNPMYLCSLRYGAQDTIVFYHFEAIKELHESLTKWLIEKGTTQGT